MEKRPHLQQMVLGNVDMQMQKDEIRHIPITLHCDARNIARINYKQQAIHV